MAPKMRKFLIGSMLLLGLLFSIWHTKTLKLHYDNLQILEKSILLVDEGVWTHYGNRGSGVGYVPGSLLTALTGLPMKIWFSPYSAVAVILLGHLLTLWILISLLRQIARPEALIWLVLLFWLNPWRVENTELYNPAFLFPCAALHLLSALKMNRPSVLWSLLHVLSIGLAAQFHFSFAVLLATTGFLAIYRHIRLSYLGVALGGALVILSFVPYWLSVPADKGINLASSSDHFLGRNGLLVYPVLKAILYWFRYLSTYYGRHIFSEIHFAWMESSSLAVILAALYHSLKWLIAALTMYISLKFNVSVFRSLGGWLMLRREQFKPNMELGEPRVQQYLFYLFCGMVLASALSPTEFNHWHLILCFPALIFAFALWIPHYRPTWLRDPSGLFWGLLLWFCIVNILSGAGSRSHQYDLNFGESFQHYYLNKKSQPGAP